MKKVMIIAFVLAGLTGCNDEAKQNDITIKQPKPPVVVDKTDETNKTTKEDEKQKNDGGLMENLPEATSFDQILAK